MVGAPKQLGEWDIGRAPAMERVTPGGSLWSRTVDGFTVGEPFHFKFAVCPDSDEAPVDSRWGGRVARSAAHANT